MASDLVKIFTVREIMDLAEMVGIPVDRDQLPEVMRQKVVVTTADEVYIEKDMRYRTINVSRHTAHFMRGNQDTTDMMVTTTLTDKTVLMHNVVTYEELQDMNLPLPKEMVATVEAAEALLNAHRYKAKPSIYANLPHPPMQPHPSTLEYGLGNPFGYSSLKMGGKKPSSS